MKRILNKAWKLALIALGLWAIIALFIAMTGFASGRRDVVETLWISAKIGAAAL